MDYFYSEQHQKLVARYKSGQYWLNTYIFPYCDPEFGNWPESDDPKTYSLITDQSNFVVRYATSYVAYKIFEEVGSWPQRKTLKRFDAKIWVEFLAEAGYTEIVDRPEAGHRYVGIKPDEGEWGIVVWLEKVVFEEDAAIVSTYNNNKYENRFVPLSDYIWVKVA